VNEQPKTIGDLLSLMLTTMERIEQKVDYIMSVVEYDENDYDDADISPYGKERDPNQPL